MTEGVTETPELLLIAPPVEKPPAEVQESALLEDHVSDDDCPLFMVLGDAEKETVGSGRDGGGAEAGGSAATVTTKLLLTVSPVELLFACMEYPYTPPVAVVGAVTDILPMQEVYEVRGVSA